MTTRRLGTLLKPSKLLTQRSCLEKSLNLEAGRIGSYARQSRPFYHWISASEHFRGEVLRDVTGFGRKGGLTVSAGAQPLVRYQNSEAQKIGIEEEIDTENSEFPGVKTNFTHSLTFIPEHASESIPCYRVLDDFGRPVPGAKLPEVDAELAKKIHFHMVSLQLMDSIFYDAQRQGRFSFYMTTSGEEAINIATAAALSFNDLVFSQYREPGVLMWRGFSLQQFANQCFGNVLDEGKGRQMPVHYGSQKLNYSTVSSPIATQLPHAVGAAYGFKMDKKDACTVCFFGDGASSEGDFHAAMNFAAVMETPTVFICRNNGWAISTPVSDQFRSHGLVVRGQSYGVQSIRVDGNDTLALYSAVKEARKIAVQDGKPVLIEALTYRIGHHSTSDDSTRYRDRNEMDYWKTIRDPVLRFRKWMETQGWWSPEEDKTLRTHLRKEVIAAMTRAESLPKPSLTELFTDVYDTPPPNLIEQERDLRATIARHPHSYPSENPGK